MPAERSTASPEPNRDCLRILRLLEVSGNPVGFRCWLGNADNPRGNMRLALCLLCAGSFRCAYARRHKLGSSEASLLPDEEAKLQTQTVSASWPAHMQA